jgi:hypothetical protein
LGSAQVRSCYAGQWLRLLVDTSTCAFIPKASVPIGKSVAYFNPQLQLKQNDDGTPRYRVRGTVGGNKIDYPGDKTALTAAGDTIKLFVNAAVSRGDFFATADIVDFYLNNHLPSPEYMRVLLRQIPIAIQHQFGIFKAHADQLHDSVYVRIDKTMYGLPQAGIISQQILVQHLTKYGYHPAPHTPCLFAHESRPISFTLVVDDFGIKYSDPADLEHFYASLRAKYSIKTCSEGSVFKYIGYTLNFDYPDHSCTLSMPGYIDKALLQFKVPPPTRRVDSPMIYTSGPYGAHTQLATTDDTAPLDDTDTKFIQEVVGVLLYYARAVDPTMLCAVSKIGSAQATPTQAVLRDAEHLLRYASCHPNASITYHASNMRLITHSDASYLSKTKARSRAGDFYFLGTNAPPDTQYVNGAIHAISSIIPAVTSSATEAEYAALFLNAVDAEGIRPRIPPGSHSTHIG